jgi:hypothetical protein
LQEEGHRLAPGVGDAQTGQGVINGFQAALEFIQQGQVLLDNQLLMQRELQRHPPVPCDCRLEMVMGWYQVVAVPQPIDGRSMGFSQLLAVLDERA